MSLSRAECMVFFVPWLKTSSGFFFLRRPHEVQRNAGARSVKAVQAGKRSSANKNSRDKKRNTNKSSVSMAQNIWWACCRTQRAVLSPFVIALNHAVIDSQGYDRTPATLCNMWSRNLTWLFCTVIVLWRLRTLAIVALTNVVVMWCRTQANIAVRLL